MGKFFPDLGCSCGGEATSGDLNGSGIGPTVSCSAVIARRFSLDVLTYFGWHRLIDGQWLRFLLWPWAYKLSTLLLKFNGSIACISPTILFSFFFFFFFFFFVLYFLLLKTKQNRENVQLFIYELVYDRVNSSFIFTCKSSTPKKTTISETYLNLISRTISSKSVFLPLSRFNKWHIFNKSNQHLPTKSNCCVDKAFFQILMIVFFCLERYIDSLRINKRPGKILNIHCTTNKVLLTTCSRFD